MKNSFYEEKIHPEAKINRDAFVDISCTIGAGVIIEEDVYI